MSERRLVLMAVVFGVLGFACLIAAHYVGEWEMAKSINALRTDAGGCIAAKDWKGAFAACRELDKKKLGRRWACAIRGECFDRMDRLPEALVQYQAADALGDDTARDSAIDVLKRMQRAQKGGE